MASKAEVIGSIKTQMFPRGAAEVPRSQPDFQELTLNQSADVVQNLFERFNPDNPYSLWIEAFAGRIPVDWLDEDMALEDIGKARRKSERLPTELVVAALANPSYQVRKAISLLQPFTPIKLAIAMRLSSNFDARIIFFNQLQLRGKPANDYTWPAFEKANDILDKWRIKYDALNQGEGEDLTETVSTYWTDEINFDDWSPEYAQFSHEWLDQVKSKRYKLLKGLEEPNQLNIWDSQETL